MTHEFCTKSIGYRLPPLMPGNKHDTKNKRRRVERDGYPIHYTLDVLAVHHLPSIPLSLYETGFAAPPESRLRRTPLGMIVSSTLSSSARTEPSPLEKTKSGSSKTKAVKPGNTGCSSPPREAGDHHAPSAAAEADSTSTSFISRAKDSDRVVMDPLGEPRKPQRVEVEYGNFHEFTAINKTGG